MTRSRLWAVVPVKDMPDAKQRLAGVLGARERRALFGAMLEDVLCALAASRCLAGILMVTRDLEARRLAARYGARVLVEEENRGHTSAVSLGAYALAQEGAAGMLQLPADIPLLAPDDITSLLQTHGPAPAVTLSPSRDCSGSNAVACSPPDLLPLRFGEDSFFPHLAGARARGIEPKVVRLPRVALDIDTPDDLALLLATPAPTRAHALLRRRRIGLGAGTGVPA